MSIKTRSEGTKHNTMSWLSSWLAATVAQPEFEEHQLPQSPSRVEVMESGQAPSDVERRTTSVEESRSVTHQEQQLDYKDTEWPSNENESDIAVLHHSTSFATTIEDERMKSLVFDDSLYRLKHVSRWPFGKFKTIALVVCCVAGLVLAVLARRSLAFVHLRAPMDFYPLYLPVDRVGLSRLSVCLNETVVVETGAVEQEFREACHIYDLSLDVVNDTNWNVARTCLGACIILGSCVTFILFLTVWYWQTMNLKPICIGLLLTYLLQSCSFFMYDSDLCRTNSCMVGQGTAYSIVASACWCIAALLSIRMDVIMMRAKRRLKRKRERALRRIQRRKRRLAKRQISAATESTTSASYDDLDRFDGSDRYEDSDRATVRETPPPSPRTVDSLRSEGGYSAEHEQHGNTGSRLCEA